MPSYAVDSSRQPMIATGIVEPVMEWMETADGGRRPSETQARDEDTGMPLWAVEVLYVQTSFGRESSVTARVTLGAEVKPEPVRLQPIGFTGLHAEVRLNKAKALVESWTAEAIAENGKQTPPRPVDKTTGEKAAGDRAGEKANEKAVA